MRVVITGGTGMIGTALALSLANDGHEIIIPSRNPRQVGPMPESIQFVKYDADTAEGWAHVVDGADAVVNLAGASLSGEGFFPSRWTDARKQEILTSRLDVGSAVVEAIEQAENKPRVLIQASGINYYGTHPHNEVITESHPPGDDFLADVCKQWEASTAAVEDMGVRRCIIRTSLVLDDEQGALPRFVFPFKLFVGGRFGNGKQSVPWIHLDDEVGAIRYLIENDNLSGPFNLTAPNVVTNREFAKAIGSALGRPSFFWVPGIFFRLMFGEVAQLVLEGQRAVPARLQEAGYQFKFTDPEAALRDLY
jgi:hypothetical protein